MSKALKRQYREAVELEKAEARRAQDAAKFEAFDRARNIPFDPIQVVLKDGNDKFIIHGRSPRQFKSQIKSNNDERKLYEAVRFLFQKYRVPEHVESIWSKYLPIENSSNYAWRRRRAVDMEGPRRFHAVNDWMTSEDRLNMYFCVARGGSLYKEITKEFLTKKETHTFLFHRHDLNFYESLVFAVAKTFAENDGIAIRLAKSKLNTYKLTDEFFKSVIYFFAKNPPESVNEVNDLMDFLAAKHQADIDQNNRQNLKFTMAGQTLDGLRRKMTDWHYELRRIKVLGDHRWEGCAIPDEEFERYDDGRLQKWKFTQIKTTKRLAEEGTQMRHCVYSYKSRCIENQVYIWSLSTIDEVGTETKRVTIELTNSGSIVQARGKANRLLKNNERRVIGYWADKHGLYISHF